MDKNLIAYCGVDCAACSDYQSGKCPGCRQTVWPEGDACLPVACCRDKGISCCGECPSFPCADMKAFYAESESHEQAYRRMAALRTGPALEIGAIVWGVLDVEREAAFWSAALDYVLKYPASDDWAILIPRNGDGVQLSLNKVSSPKARRHHMDLFAEDMQAEAERLLSLGATRKPWNYPPDADYIVLQDPDGNPFCVVQR